MKQTTRIYISICVAAFAGILAAYGAIESQNFGMASMWFPAFASLVTLAAALGVLGKEIYALSRLPATETAGEVVPAQSKVLPGDDDDGVTFPGFLYWLAWFFGLVAALVILGGYIGTLVWLSIFLYWPAKQPLRLAIIGPIVMTAAIYGLHRYFDFAVPPPLYWPF